MPPARRAGARDAIRYRCARRLFGTTMPWVKAARNLGLGAVARLPLAKRLLAQSALR